MKNLSLNLFFLIIYQRILSHVLTSLSVANLILIALRCCLRCWKFLSDNMSTNFQFVLFYGRHMWGGFSMTVIRHVCLCFRYPFKIFLGYNYGTFPFDTCTYDACQTFALMVVLTSGINIRWSMYFMVCAKEFISGRLG